MKQCKYCGDSWIPKEGDTCYTCLAYVVHLGKDVALARIVYDQSLLAAALRGNRQRYFTILQELEKTNE